MIDHFFFRIYMLYEISKRIENEVVQRNREINCK